MSTPAVSIFAKALTICLTHQVVGIEDCGSCADIRAVIAKAEGAA